jgi:hypothetical protein
MLTLTDIDRDAPVIAQRTRSTSQRPSPPFVDELGLHGHVDDPRGRRAPPHPLGWAQGIMGTHECLFEETPTGVHVITNESFAREPVQADPDGIRGTCDTSLTSWLARLKTQAESVA